MSRKVSQTQTLLSYSAEYYSQKRAVWFLISLCAVSIGVYMYFVSASIVNVVVREETEQRVQETRSAIGALEREYLKVRQDITLAHAESAGFVAVSQKTYATKTHMAGVSLNNTQ